MNLILPLTLIAFLAVVATGEEISVGETRRGTIHDGSATVAAERTTTWRPRSPIRGDVWTLEVEHPASIRIEARSAFFNGYLVLRDDEGTAIAAENGGNYGLNPRIVEEVTPGRYRIEVASLGGVGAYELAVIAGVRPDEPPEARFARSSARAREDVARAREELGPEDPGLAWALTSLGEVQVAMAEYEAALATFERALELRMAALEPDDPRIASSWRQVAMANKDLARWDDAEDAITRAIEIRTRALGAEHPATARDVGERVSQLFLQGRPQDAVPLAEQVVDTYEATLGPEDPALMGAWNQLALVLDDIGELEESLGYYERALAASQRIYGPEGDSSSFQNNLASLLQRMGRFEEAEDLYQQALETRRRIHGPEHPRTATVYNNIGSLHYRRGQYDKVGRYWEEAYRIRERALGPTHSLTLASLGNLVIILRITGQDIDLDLPLAHIARTLDDDLLRSDGNVLYTCEILTQIMRDQGEWAECRRHLERILAIKTERYGPNSSETIRTRINLSKLYFSLDMQAEARLALEQIVRDADDALGPDHEFSMLARESLADALRNEHDLEGALYVREQLVQAAERHGLRNESTCRNLGFIADLQQRLGRSDDAAETLARASDLADELYEPDTSPRAYFDHILALVLAAQGRYPEAIAAERRSAAALERIFGPGSFGTFSRQTAVVLLESKHGDPDEALRTARAVLRDADATLNQTLGTLSDHERLAFARRYRYLVATTLQIADQFPEEEDVARWSYEAVLRSKGRISRQILSRRERLQRSRDAETAEKLEELRGIQSWLTRLLYAESVPDRAAHEARLRELRERRDQIERELNLAGVEERSNERTTVQSIASSLPTDAFAVDFLVHGPPIKPGSPDENWVTAWITRSGQTGPAQRVDLGSERELETITRDFLLATARRTIDPRGARLSAPQPSPAEEFGAELYQRLWAPIAPHVGDADLVFVSPDGFLGTLPFEVLPTDGDDEFLLDHHRFVYLQDMSRLDELSSARSTNASAAGLLVVGDVDYDAELDLADDSPDLEDPSREPARTWPPLPNTGEEARRLLDLYRQHASDPAFALLGEDATADSLRTALPELRFVHIATHGFFQPPELIARHGMVSAGRARAETSPEVQRIAEAIPGLLSGLVCAGANRSESEYLTAEEVAWLDLTGCELLVLSACETGLGTKRGGDGMMSLRQSFRQAGARTVISSLWAVDDRATRDMMVSFYRHLWIDGASKIDALHSARHEILDRRREQGLDPAPHLWGAFVLDGDWR